MLEAPGPRTFWPVGQVVQFRRDPLALLAKPLPALPPKPTPKPSATAPP